MKLFTQLKQEAYENRFSRNTFRNEDGVIDLASIMVGVIIIGLIGGVIAATVFAVIPWSQDNAAKHQLDSIAAAESAYRGLSSAMPSPLPAGSLANSFGDSGELETASLLSQGKRYCVATSADKKTYVGYSQSASGVLFYITDKNSKPSILNETLPAECSFISEGIGSTTSPVTYVDPTPTITKITFQCLSNTSGRLPLGGNLTGTATWTDSNNVTTTENYTKATFSSMKTLTAGITYTLAFDGTYDNFGVDSTSGYPLLVQNCLTSVDHFGEQTGVKSFRSAFTNNTRNFSVPENIPSTVTDLSRAFYGAQNFNAANVSKWNTSNVTNFDSVFYQAYNFNQPLNSWDMSKAKNLNSMFMFASKFNQPLDKWNVSGATSMSSMFNRAVAFDQPLNSWDVSNVTSMSYMFNDAKYNQPLDRWDVSKVQSMEGMFQGVNNMTQFNQDISGWRVSSVTDFDSMFFGNAIFYQDLSKWPAKSTASRTDFSRGSKLATNTAYLPKFNGV